MTHGIHQEPTKITINKPSNNTKLKLNKAQQATIHASLTTPQTPTQGLMLTFGHKLTLKTKMIFEPKTTITQPAVTSHSPTVAQLTLQPTTTTKNNI
jgi:hypothetical protein